jgi:hypothetical protein
VTARQRRQVAQRTENDRDSAREDKNDVQPEPYGLAEDTPVFDARCLGAGSVTQ